MLEDTKVKDQKEKYISHNQYAATCPGDKCPEENIHSRGSPIRVLPTQALRCLECEMALLGGTHFCHLPQPQNATAGNRDRFREWIHCDPTVSQQCDLLCLLQQCLDLGKARCRNEHPETHTKKDKGGWPWDVACVYRHYSKCWRLYICHLLYARSCPDHSHTWWSAHSSSTPVRAVLLSPQLGDEENEA